MALSLKVQHFVKLPNTPEPRLEKVTPYVRLAAKGDPPVFIQAGAVYSEGGQEIQALPAWFAEEVAKLTPKVRAEVGWPEPKAKPRDRAGDA